MGNSHVTTPLGFCQFDEKNKRNKNSLFPLPFTLMLTFTVTPCSFVMERKSWAMESLPVVIRKMKLLSEYL